MKKIVKKSFAVMLIFIMTVSTSVQAAELSISDNKSIIELSENELSENVTVSEDTTISENTPDEDEMAGGLSDNNTEEGIEEQEEREFEESASGLKQMTQSEYDGKMNSFITNPSYKNGISWGEGGCVKYANCWTGYMYGLSTVDQGEKYYDTSEIRAGDTVRITNHTFVVLKRNGNKLYTAEGAYSNKVRITDAAYTIVSGRIINEVNTGNHSFEHGYHYVNITSDVSESVTFSKPSYQLFLKNEQGKRTVEVSGKVTHNVNLSEGGIRYRKKGASSWSTISSKNITKNPVAFLKRFNADLGNIYETYIYAISASSGKEYKSSTVSIYIPGEYRLTISDCNDFKIVNSKFEFDALLVHRISKEVERVYCEYDSLQYKGSYLSGSEPYYKYHFSIPKRSDNKYNFKIGIETTKHDIYSGDYDCVYVPVSGVKLNKTSATIVKGSSKKLDRTILPSNASNNIVTWSSSDKKIATVASDGTVKGVAAGTATITAKTSDGGKTATCKVTVTNPTVAVTGVALNKKTLSFNKIGDTATLKATITPSNATNKTVTWSSTDTNVATVKNGVVTSVSSGSADIKVKTKDGGKTATCKVTVTISENKNPDVTPEVIVPVTEVKLDKSQIRLEVGKTALVEAAVYPENATDKMVTWQSDEESVAVVSDNGLITAKAPGNAVIMAVARDGGYYDGCRVEVFEPEEEITPDDDLKDDPDISLPENEVPDGIWIYGVNDFQYTGKEVKPSVKVYDGKKLLVEKKNYTVSFKNNKKACDYSDEDFALFNDKLKSTGKRERTGSFDPKKAPQIIISMKGEYKGKETAYFRILPQDLAGDSFSVDDIYVKYNGKKQKPVPSVTWESRKLKYNTDYVVKEYRESAYGFTGSETGVKSYDLTVVGKGDFRGERKLSLNIVGTYGNNGDGTKYVLMDKVSVSKIPDQKYTGNPILPEGAQDGNEGSFNMSLTYKGKLLENGKEYTCQLINNTKCGKATIILRGTGLTDGDTGFVGIKKVCFNIIGEDISLSNVNGLEQSGYRYTGKRIEPQIKVMGVSPEDYDIEYINNINVGKASVIITGKNAFSGRKKEDFLIKGYPINGPLISVNGSSNNTNISVRYVKGGAKPSMSLAYEGKKLVEGRDYTLKYINFDKVASSITDNPPSIIIKGKGNFSGSGTVKYSIIQADTSKVRMFASDVPENSKPNKYQTGYILIDKNGRQLMPNVDYDGRNVYYYRYSSDGSVGRRLTKSDRPVAGSMIMIAVKGIGCYKNGNFSAVYKVSDSNRDISKAEFKIKPQCYTGSPVRIYDNDQFISAVCKSSRGGGKLELGRDFEIVTGSYSNNTGMGTSTVILHGIGDYGGYKLVSFKIGARSVADWWRGIIRKAV